MAMNINSCLTLESNVTNHSQLLVRSFKLNSGENMSIQLEKCIKSRRRTQGIILTIGGILVCLLGFIFSSNDWSPKRSFLGNIGSAKIIVIKGKHVLLKKHSEILEEFDLAQDWQNVDKYELKGRLAIPLKFILAVGVVLAGVGIALIAIDS